MFKAQAKKDPREGGIPRGKGTFLTEENEEGEAAFPMRGGGEGEGDFPIHRAGLPG